MRRSRLLLLAGLLLPLPCAAQGTKKPAAPPRAASGPDLPSQAPAGAPLATVNGEAVPLSLYLDRLSLTFGPQIRESLIEEALVRQEAKRRKLTASATEISSAAGQAYTESVRRYGDEKKLAEELKRARGWTPADYKAVIQAQTETQVLRRKLAESLVKASSVTDKDVEARYTEQRTAFAEPDTVKISHILVRRADDGGESADQAAKTRAEGLLAKVKGGDPARFAEVARESSDDKATGPRGGEIPTPIARGANPFGAAFEAAVFGAPVGLVEEVVATPLGYHIIRVDSAKPGRTVPLSEVREQIRTAMVTEARARALEELVVRLRTSAKVETGKF